MKKLVIENVSKHYDRKAILSKINLSISQNECIGIMGESGSGKSTLAKLLVGLEHFDEGNIVFNEISYKNINKKQLSLIHRKIQLVFQNAFGAVNPKYTVEEVLTEPLKIHYKKEITYDEMKKRAEIFLEKVGLNPEFMSQKAIQLSGGQLQRICIARALILEPEIIIFDESVSGLDPIIQEQILELLGSLKETMNLTYIFISHDFEACYYLCDKIVIIENGEIADIIENLDSPVIIKNERIKRILGKAVNFIETIQ
ncbi:nickel import ATP-binding protein NikE [Leptotrichia hongkongensis]|jgi:ABC transporter related|uniref:Nickel import ATP-binding protein NikE n=1 Tax=Leptotrichia hongkongensis TaxID=554406 RepID=A0A510L5X1_9FUSO|nr:dipeptide/oligopeptide/nickel ABC transporter ATP-binding protein [Leptotrichia hongkongensis]BBM58491.1 nickel import ATP-binding protein NikE [Leptotrichia hongkongensis]